MLRLTCHITIADFVFKSIVEFESESSWENMTDTAKITLPRKLNWKGKKIYELLKIGDKVNVQLGYDDNNVEVFQGYITKISAKIPVEFELEDAGWLLKQSSITKSYKEIELHQLLKEILPVSLSFEAPTVTLGQFRISKATAAQVLDELKSSYFLHSWFRAGTLYVGFAYVAKLQKVHKLFFDKNIIDNDLDYVSEDQVKIKLTIVNIKKDNSKKEYEFGEKDGEERTLHYFDMSEADIKKLGQSEIKRLKYTGYRGSFTTFGVPVVNHGDVVALSDPEYPERDGSYLVKSVSTSFGSGGYRQSITLDTKVA